MTLFWCRCCILMQTDFSLLRFGTRQVKFWSVFKLCLDSYLIDFDDSKVFILYQICIVGFPPNLPLNDIKIYSKRVCFVVRQPRCEFWLGAQWCGVNVHIPWFFFIWNLFWAYIQFTWSCNLRINMKHTTWYYITVAAFSTVPHLYLAFPCAQQSCAAEKADYQLSS